MIFKFSALERFQHLTSEFTFQSGDIRIYDNEVHEQILPKFTFQSGDIRIKAKHGLVKPKKKEFTFQSGDIQIFKLMFIFTCSIIIYIPIW